MSTWLWAHQAQTVVSIVAHDWTGAHRSPPNQTCWDSICAHISFHFCDNNFSHAGALITMATTWHQHDISTADMVACRFYRRVGLAALASCVVPQAARARHVTGASAARAHRHTARGWIQTQRRKTHRKTCIFFIRSASWFPHFGCGGDKRAGIVQNSVD